MDPTSAAIVQSASDVQCSRLLKTTMEVVAEGALLQIVGGDKLIIPFADGAAL